MAPQLLMAPQFLMAPQRRSLTTALAISLLPFAALPACDWTAFDELEEGASVVTLSRAPGASGFGRGLASAANNDYALLLVLGTPSRSPAAAYSLGFDQQPAADAAQEGYCSRGNNNLDSCYGAEQGSFFSVENSRREADLCFAYAWGALADANNEGVLVRCFGDGTDLQLRAPSRPRSARIRDFEVNEDNQPLWFASDSSAQPWLVAALLNQRAAWYYVAGTVNPAPLSLPTPESAGESFGKGAAVLRLVDNEDERLFAVSAPEQGQVWLYRADALRARAVGCLGERPSFGRALASGDVDGDGADDLVVAEEDLVTVFSGEGLAALPEAFSETCSLAALPGETLLGSFGCGSRFALSDCGASQFGASLAVGDLDADGDGEVIVGAPRMTVNGNERGGAVLVYDVEGRNPHTLSDVLYLSSAAEGDLLGTSVVSVPQNKKPDVVVAGGPGNSKVAVFYCSELIDPEDREGRCAP